MAPAVTVAVVSHNTRDLLDRCLTSLSADVEAGAAQVWVVDNASTDGSATMVREHHAWAQVIESDINLGFGAAVNLVATRTSSQWLAPANADIELTPGALAALLAAGEKDARLGAIAPRLLAPEGATQHSVFAFPTLALAAAHNSGLASLVPGLGDAACLPGRWNPDRAREVDWAVGAFLLVRRRDWDRVGGFDADQWMYAEDLDLGWRLARAGAPTYYEPDATVLHREGSATTAAWGEERTERWLQATYAWMLRRRGALHTRCYAVLNLAGSAIRALALAPAALLAPRRFQSRFDVYARWTRLHLRCGLARRREIEGWR